VGTPSSRGLPQPYQLYEPVFLGGVQHSSGGWRRNGRRPRGGEDNRTAACRDHFKFVAHHVVAITREPRPHVVSGVEPRDPKSMVVIAPRAHERANGLDVTVIR